MRVIFSVYIDFEETDFEKNKDFDKNVVSKNAFKENYDYLKASQEKYAKEIKKYYEKGNIE